MQDGVDTSDKNWARYKAGLDAIVSDNAEAISARHRNFKATFASPPNSAAAPAEVIVVLGRVADALNRNNELMSSMHDLIKAQTEAATFMSQALRSLTMSANGRVVGFLWYRSCVL
jgi:hypothetical protein